MLEWLKGEIFLLAISKKGFKLGLRWLRKDKIFSLKGWIFLGVFVLIFAVRTNFISAQITRQSLLQYKSGERSFNAELDVEVSYLHNLETGESEWSPEFDLLFYAALSKNVSFYERLAAFDWPFLKEAYIEWTPANFRVWFGRKRICWGPAYYGNLLIGPWYYDRELLAFKEQEGLNAVGLQVRMGDFTAKYFTSILQSEGGRDDKPQRNLCGHRFEWRPKSNLTLAFSETVLYTHRGIEPLYAMPSIISYYWIDGYFRDVLKKGVNDNFFMSFDVDWKVDEKKRVYWEFLIDDMEDELLIPGEHTEYPQLLGTTLGGEWKNPFGSKAIDLLRLEYTAITRWVYAPTIGGHEATKYTYHDRIIGHWLGPDADLLTGEVVKNFGKKLQVFLMYQRERHGEGRDISEPWNEEEYGTETQFLSGTVETSHRIRAGMEYFISKKTSGSFIYEHENIINEDNQLGKEKNIDRIKLGLKARF